MAILKDQELYPYHIQQVQSLVERNVQPRINLCLIPLETIALIPLFLPSVLLTDEAGFFREGIIN